MAAQHKTQIKLSGGRNWWAGCLNPQRALRRHFLLVLLLVFVLVLVLVLVLDSPVFDYEDDDEDDSVAPSSPCVLALKPNSEAASRK